MSEKLYLLGEEYEICSGDENYKMLRVSFDEWYGVFIRELDNEIYLDGKPHTVDKDALLRYLTKFSNGIYYWVEDMCKIFKYPNSREVHDFVRIDGAGNGYISERRSSFINERMKNQKSIIELQKKIPIPGEDYDDYLEIIKEYAEHTFLSVLLIFQERLDIMIFDYTVDFDEYNDTFSKLAKLVGKMDEKEHNQNKDKIRDLIMMNPYDERGYKLCVDMYGDSDNSLVNFAKWHKIELFSYKQKVLNDLFEGFEIKDEKDIINLKGKFESPCDLLGIDIENFIQEKIQCYQKQKKEDEYAANAVNIFELTYNCIKENNLYSSRDKALYVYGKSPNFETKYKVVKEIVKPSNEIIILICDATLTGNAKTGFLLTNSNMYLYEAALFGKSMVTNVCIPLKNIKRVVFEYAKLIVYMNDGESVEINCVLGGGEQDDIKSSKMLDLIIGWCMNLDEQTISLVLDRQSNKNSLPKEEIKVASNNKNTGDLQIMVQQYFQNNRKQYEDIMGYIYNGLEFNQKVKKMILNLKVDAGEIPLLLFDSTIFGTGKKGIVVTNKKVYGTGKNPISMNKIVAISQNGSDLVVSTKNGKSEYDCSIISSKKVGLLVKAIAEIMNIVAM